MLAVRLFGENRTRNLVSLVSYMMLDCPMEALGHDAGMRLHHVLPHGLELRKCSEVNLLIFHQYEVSDRFYFSF